MDIQDIINSVFGEEYNTNESQDTPRGYESDSESDYFDNLRTWLNSFLRQTGINNAKPPDILDGRIGPALVRFDTTAHSGLFMISPDRLNVQSQSDFASIKANVCVFSGKWQFEVQLGTKGVMQVGWCTAKCKFSKDAGVGDTINSYSFDGNRVRKWNVVTSKYGQPWLSGDVIGCCLDLDIGTIHFIRNGENMGIAFEKLRLGPGISFFPVVSLAYNDNLCANFGGTPLKYPQDDYRPLQEPPHSDIVKANFLFKYLIKLISVLEQVHSHRGSIAEAKTLTSDAAILRLSCLIMDTLGPLLWNSYVVAECLLPCLYSFCRPRNPTKNKSPNVVNRQLMTIMDILWSFCATVEIEKCIDHVYQNILGSFKEVSKNLTFKNQRRSLQLLVEILKHEQTRKYLLNHLLFKKVGFANFMHLKPIDDANLPEFIPEVWWKSPVADIEHDKTKKGYMDSVLKIQEATGNLEEMQLEMLSLLLINTDGNANEPSSRKIFVLKLRRYTHDLLKVTKNISSAHTPPPVALCTFYRLFNSFLQVWAKEESDGKKKQGEPRIGPEVFYDGTIEYFGIDRIGGVLSHIRKAFRDELVQDLGEDHPVFKHMDNPAQYPEIDDISNNLMDAALGLFLAGPSGQSMVGNSPVNILPIMPRMMQQPNAQLLLTRLANNHNLRNTPPPIPPGPLEAKQSRLDMLDTIILYYHTLAHKQLTKIADMRDAQSELISALKDNRDRITYIKKEFTKKSSKSAVVKPGSINDPGMSTSQSNSDDDVIAVLQKSEQVFIKRLDELSRQLAWARAVLISPTRRRELSVLLGVVLNVLQECADKGQLYAFVPEYYIEALCQLTTAVHDLAHPVLPNAKDVEEFGDLIEGVAAWLCTYFSDPRVVLAATKDTLVQGLGSLAMYPSSLRAMERVPVECRLCMVRSLLRPYENRAWAQSNWLLVRFWQGRGFAFREARAPQGFMGPTPRPNPTMSDTGLLHRYCDPCPSEVFQGHVGELLLHEQLATSFLNSVLNQLNWAFSEFIGMLQEIQSISLRPERVFIESRQLKICATCFELTVSLLRVVEMVTYVAPHVFLDQSMPASDLLLSRLLQLISQIFNRISSTSGCFQHAVTLSLPDLGIVGHFSILAATVGVLFGLLGTEILRTEGILPKNKSLKSVPRICRSLLTEPSFQISSLKFVLGQDVTVVPNSQVEVFSFANFPGSVTPTEVSQLHKIIDSLETYSGLLSASTVLGDDIACPICYARPLSATFSPCGHRSCAACIAHHLMNSRRCFFCMAKIEVVHDFNGAVLHVTPPA